MNDKPTVRVICKTCSCPLAFVRAEYSPDHHRDLDAATTGPIAQWSARNAPLIAYLQTARKTTHDVAPVELREQHDEPVSHPLDSLSGAVSAWCDRHGFIPVSAAGLRARHDEAMRTGRRVVWRIPPHPKAL